MGLHKKYVAAMVMAGVGDSLGYYCGSWEFNFSGPDIHKEVAKLGGLSKLKNKSKYSSYLKLIKCLCLHFYYEMKCYVVFQM